VETEGIRKLPLRVILINCPFVVVRGLPEINWNTPTMLEAKGIIEL
jgi:hypothetical protein